MKTKEFDDFSFRAHSLKDSQQQIPFQQHIPPQKQIKPSDIRYRHIDSTPPKKIFDQQINNRITSINQELQDNIKRRIQLQKKLQKVKKEQQKNQGKKIMMAYSQGVYKEPKEVQKKFKEIQEKADNIDWLVRTEDIAQIRGQQLQKTKENINKDIKLPSQQYKIIVPVINTLSNMNPKPLKIKTVPDQIKIQKLLRKCTFPQLPSDNLDKLQKEAQMLLAIHQPHSDIHYILMVIYFHQEKYLKVRKHYQEIQMFKVFNPKVVWIAAQAEFAMENSQLCLQLTQKCMNTLEGTLLPRFIHLKARCYEKQANYINSIVCLNQLLKLKPKISQYYFERGLLYHRIGYFKQAKQDFVMFGVLNPDAEAVIKQKILTEKVQSRRKEYIAVLAKIF